MKKICVVTGSRAEYGILRRLMAAIKADPELQLQVIATNRIFQSSKAKPIRKLKMMDSVSISKFIWPMMMQ